MQRPKASGALTSGLPCGHHGCEGSKAFCFLVSPCDSTIQPTLALVGVAENLEGVSSFALHGICYRC